MSLSNIKIKKNLCWVLMEIANIFNLWDVIILTCSLMLLLHVDTPPEDLLVDYFAMLELVCLRLMMRSFFGFVATLRRRTRSTVRNNVWTIFVD